MRKGTVLMPSLAHWAHIGHMKGTQELCALFAQLCFYLLCALDRSLALSEPSFLIHKVEYSPTLFR